MMDYLFLEKDVRRELFDNVVTKANSNIELYLNFLSKIRFFNFHLYKNHIYYKNLTRNFDN